MSVEVLKCNLKHLTQNEVEKEEKRNKKPRWNKWKTARGTF